MKQLTKVVAIKSFLTLLFLAFMQVALMAQENQSGSSSSTTTTITKSEATNWYTSPWVWVVGGLVFILLLVAVVRGGSRSSGASSTDRVTVTKTVRRDTDV